MKRALSVSNLCVALLVVLGACVGSVGLGPEASGFDLTIAGDANMQDSHGGQSVSVTVAAFGMVVAQRAATVSRTADVAFSFFFPGLLARGFVYQVHYWIDSNSGGGSAGVCDVTDHQGSVSFSAEQDFAIFVDDDHDNVTFCPSFDGGVGDTSERRQ